MVNPETIPCSIEQLFNLPPPPPPPMPTKVKVLPHNAPTIIASSGTVINPVIPPPIAPSIVPVIAPKVNIPLRVVAEEPKMIVNKVGKGLSTGLKIAFAMGVGFIGGLLFFTWLNTYYERKKEKNPV